MMPTFPFFSGIWHPMARYKQTTPFRDMVCGRSFMGPIVDTAVAVLVFKKERSGSVGLLIGEPGEAMKKSCCYTGLLVT